MASLGDGGMWGAVNAFEEESGVRYDPVKKPQVERLLQITDAIMMGNVEPAIKQVILGNLYA